MKANSVLYSVAYFKRSFDYLRFCHEQDVSRTENKLIKRAWTSRWNYVSSEWELERTDSVTARKWGEGILASMGDESQPINFS